jgi:glycosyltransferase involved in cell wall biosynthesis
MALVEAMTMEIPVFGSNISGINFVLKDFKNLLFETSNANDLSEKIKDFYSKSKEERRAIGKELRAYCLSNFSLKKFIHEHEVLYLKLVEKN